MEPKRSQNDAKMSSKWSQTELKMKPRVWGGYWMDVGDFGKVLNGFGMFLGGFLMKFEKVCEKKRASRSFAETGFHGFNC